MKRLTEKEEQNRKQRELFSKCVFLLNRETPIYILQHLILSLGGKFATEEDTDFLAKNKITHHVIDRPLSGKLDSTRDYVQPQWIADSMNNLFLLPTQSYRPGVPPPPHLSPFVENAKEGYIPTRQKEINQLKGEVVDDLSDDEEESEEEAPVPPKKETKTLSKQEPVKTSSKGDADSSSDEDDVIQEKKAKALKNEKLKKDLKKEQEELGKILMSKKQRQLLEKAEQSNRTKKDQAQKLKEKRKIIEQKKKQ